MGMPGKANPSINSGLKRSVDLVVASLGLALTSPILAAVALLIYLDMGPPVLYRQTRTGYRMSPFTILKFRTMRDLRRANGVPLPDTERTTVLGRFLRRTSLDELPQLYNVIRGDMSLIGPRPQVDRHIARCDGDQLRRHEVRPGITGWAQVNGRNSLSWEEKFRHDCWYVDHWSLWLDLEIAMRTVVTVARCEGTDETSAMAPTSVSLVAEAIAPSAGGAS